MRLLVLVSCLFSFAANGQIISGELKDEGRKLVSTANFIVEGTANGYAKYEVAVNREGEVTSVRLIETDIKSTPTKMKLRDYAMKLVFEKGTYYPKFHHAVVRLTSVKSL